MPAVDLPGMVRQLAATPGTAVRRELLGELAEWGPHEENTARLLDVLAYDLDWRWGQGVIDPDDPDVKRERAEAKRAGVKPPPHPLIPPVAHRPTGVAEQRLNEYLERVTEYATPKERSHSVSRAAFDAAHGLD